MGSIKVDKELQTLVEEVITVVASNNRIGEEKLSIEFDIEHTDYPSYRIKFTVNVEPTKECICHH